jgi:protein-S-isoprenylcysteine O-methyltransferase Ste14
VGLLALVSEDSPPAGEDVTASADEDDVAPSSTAGVWLNLAAGLSVWSWAYLGIRHSWLESGEVGAVRIVGAAIHGLVGTLFLLRRPLLADGSLAQLSMALPSFVMGGLAFRLAPSPEAWSFPAVGIFVAGGVVALVALSTLGRSFAVLPARRELVARGIYRYLRHPAYAGETLLVVAMVVAAMRWESALALVVFVPTIIWRIRAEEQVMGEEEDYGRYKNSVKWRIFPWVW